MSDPRLLRQFEPPGPRGGSPQIAAGAGARGGELRRVSHFRSDMWTRNASPRRAVAEFASREYGVVALRELLDLGLSRTGVKRWEADGGLHRLYPGIYAVGHAAITGFQATP